MTISFFLLLFGCKRPQAGCDWGLSWCVESNLGKGFGFGWLLEFYVLATSNVISGWVPTFDSAHSWRLYSAVPLGNQATSIMTRYPAQPCYPTVTSPCPILLTPSAKLGSNKYQFSLFYLGWGLNSRSPARVVCALPIKRRRLFLFSFFY